MKNRRTLPRQFSFNNAFRLEGHNRMLPAGVYQTDIEEVFLESDGKPAYHRYQVKIHLPETAGGAQPFLAMTPANFDALCQRDRDLTQAAYERDECWSGRRPDERARGYLTQMATEDTGALPIHAVINFSSREEQSAKSAAQDQRASLHLGRDISPEEYLPPEPPQ
jgi:hypothetical protein